MADHGPPAPGARRVPLPFAPAFHCWSCGDPIQPHQAAGQGGVCDKLECRAAWVRRRLDEDRRIQARREEQARDALHEGGVDPDRVSWSLTPANAAELVPLTRERRDAFLRHLRRTVEEAVSVNPAPRPAPPHGDEGEGRFPPPGEAEGRALAVGCAACRGWCCRRGGTHAFLDTDRLRRLLRERPDLQPEDIPDLYASHLGEHHLEGGCVFQGETGCRLPREIRGDTCNRYYCPDLVAARRLWRRPGGDGTHHFVALAHPDEKEPRIRDTSVPDL